MKWSMKIMQQDPKYLPLEIITDSSLISRLFSSAVTVNFGPGQTHKEGLKKVFLGIIPKSPDPPPRVNLGISLSLFLVSRI